MRKIVAWPIAWGLYYLGHMWSKPLEWDWPDNKKNEDKKWVEWYVGFWYVPYNNLMNWSLRVNDWGGLNVWVKSNPERTEIELAVYDIEEENKERNGN